MGRSIRTLLVEDSPADAELILHTLRRAEFEPVHLRVDTEDDYVGALDSDQWDIVISDYRMPRFGGMEALRLLQERKLEVPFIFVTGTISEETAVDCLKCGADNYVLKENLARLGPAVDRALEMYEERRERRRLEQQLRQAQKMEAVGQLAGGVAHDFNNLLQAIQGYTDLAMIELPPDHPVLANLEEVRKAAQRAAGLTRQLLVFSRQESLQPADLDLNEVIGDLIKMLRRVIPENVELTVAPGAELWRVYADPGQIEQVLMNLCVNARDAMPHGGRLTIETGTIHISADYCQSHPWAREGQFVWLSVTDTGVGIPPDVQEHIFEPFFTTKEVGEGTGLGLATVYGIVKQHEGIINVYSEPGHGTAFRVYLPASKAARAQPGPRAEMEHVAGGSETILLAEDDELVRNLAISILRRAGYRVLSARDGQEAMDMLDRQTELDLAILDVIMPRRGGREVCTALRRRMPRVPVLFCSGYSYTAMAADQLPQGARLIQKPYGANELLRNVRDLLDSASGDEAPG